MVASAGAKVISIWRRLTVPHRESQMKVQARIVIVIAMMIVSAAPNGQLLAAPNWAAMI